jgi:hypothetical protein
MKNIFFHLIVLATILCAGITNAMAQTMAKPATPQTQTAGTTNTPKFKTEAEQLAYNRRQKQLATMQQAKAAQVIAAEKSNNQYAKLLAYEKEQLANIDLTTKQGQLKRLAVQKAFYLQNGDTATAAKVEAAINATK